MPVECVVSDTPGHAPMWQARRVLTPGPACLILAPAVFMRVLNTVVVVENSGAPMAFRNWIKARMTARLRRIHAGIDPPPVLDMARHFPAHDELVALWPALRDEALAVHGAHPRIPRFHDISPTQRRISAGDGLAWRMLMVQSYGHVIRANAAHKPVLAEFLARHPEVATAALSYLDQGKHIPRHRGPFRGVLRYHRCLHAPDGGTDLAPWLEVDGQRFAYRDGEGLLWDDTFVHEVRVPGPAPRLALLLDLRRQVTRWLHRAIYGNVMTGGRLISRGIERRMRMTGA